MVRKQWVVIMMCLVLGMISASCTGPQGPMGPSGAAGSTGANGVDGTDGVDGDDGADGTDGSGTLATYVFDVTPATSSGTTTVSCPLIFADNVGNNYSTVNCYLHWSGFNDSPAVPYKDTEGDTSTTDYFYSIETGQVILGWINSSTTVPQPFQLIVTVVSP